MTIVGERSSSVAQAAALFPFEAITASGRVADPVAYFRSLGYPEMPPYNLIQSVDFNGGLNYDPLPVDPGLGKIFRIQPCGRLEDAAKRHRPGVLAYFHVLALQKHRGADRGEIFTDVMGFMTKSAGLAPDRLAFVSSELFNPYRDLLQRFDIKPEQVVIRSMADAMATGDGDGYFNPAGHPLEPALPTVGIHYALDGDSTKSPPAYPLTGYLELGELALAPAAEIEIPLGAGALGLERMAMAQGAAIGTFEQSRQRLLEALQTEAEERGVPLPAAYSIFSSLE